MKNSRSVCLLCRHRLATSVSTPPAGSPRPTQHARFIASTSTSAAVQDVPDTKETGPAAAAPSSSFRTQKILTPLPIRQSRVESKSGRAKAPAAKAQPNVDLFQQIIAEQREADKRIKSSEDSASAKLDLTLVQRVKELYDLVEKGGSPVPAYDYLKTEIYPIIRNDNILVPEIFYMVVISLMERMTAFKKADMLRSDLPSVAEIFQVYADLGELRPAPWASLVGEIVVKLVEMGSSAEDYTSAKAYQRYPSGRAALLDDLIESWKVLSAPKFYDVSMSEGRELLDGFWFPSLNKFSLARFASTGNFTAAFSSVFPQYHSVELGEPVAALTIATYAVLQDPDRGTAYARQSAARFTTYVAYLITTVEISEASLRKLFNKTFPQLEPYVMGQWPRIISQLKSKFDAKAEARSRDPRVLTLPYHPRNFRGVDLETRLHQAYSDRNIRAVDQMWRDFTGGTDLSQERVSQLRYDADLIDNFVNTYMALGQSAKALEAWSMIKKIALVPTLKTWNAMLDGCKKARNVDAVKNIWAKLVAANMELDTAIWTTRVSALIEGGDIAGGVQALEEMARLSKEAARINKEAPNGKKKHAVPLTIEPINAAVVGLIRAKMGSTAEKVLAWANRQGIKPNIFTYNTLLQPLVRNGRHREVQSLLKQMAENKVAADPATFTIVLDAALAGLKEPSSQLKGEELKNAQIAFEEEQERTVMNVLSKMEEAGLQTNLHLYGKMIYILLQNGGDLPEGAIRAVLTHLWERGFDLSPHIYTMLAEHYFERQPPALGEVEKLLKRQRLLVSDAATGGRDKHPLPEMDRVFYDRVVKGYALKANDPTTALDLTYRLSTRGHIITLGVQAELLQVLMRHGLRDDARALVAHTRRHFEELHGAPPPPQADNNQNRSGDSSDSALNFWEHLFWTLAEKYELN